MFTDRPMCNELVWALLVLAECQAPCRIPEEDPMYSASYDANHDYTTTEEEWES